jgi:hypothetical protein
VSTDTERPGWKRVCWREPGTLEEELRNRKEGLELSLSAKEAVVRSAISSASSLEDEVDSSRRAAVVGGGRARGGAGRGFVGFAGMVAGGSAVAAFAAVTAAA